MSHSDNNVRFSRRFLLGSLSAFGLGGLIPGGLEGAEVKPVAALDDCVDSFPMLQNPTPSTINVVWAIKRPGTGYVEWGKTRELGETARNSYLGLHPYDSRVMTAEITQLSPNTRYFYRTVTVGMDFPRYGQIVAGKPVYSAVYSFVTPGPNAPQASFAMMNDTHENQAALKTIAERLLKLKADYTIWNGDLLNDVNNEEQAVKGVLQAGGLPFAAEKPILFTCGNHDHRGPWARSFQRLMLPWRHDDPRYRDLGYNFAVRQGPIVFIGLDTGEDKPDENPIWSGLSNFAPYRRLQAQWLEDTLNMPEVKSAPFVVASCHIPLFDPDPNANPGDILTDYASWQRPCAQAWSPVFNKYGVQLVLAAHRHKFAFHLPNEKRHWLQLRGGGPNPASLAMIHGKADLRQLVVEADDLTKNTSLGRWELKSRT